MQNGLEANTMVTFAALSELMMIAAVIVSSFALAIYVGSKKPSSRVFVGVLVVTVVWILSWTVYPTSADLRDYLFRISDFLGSLIAAGFFYFCLRFPDDKKVSGWITGSLILLELAFVALYYSGLIEYGSLYVGGSEEWTSIKGPLLHLRDIAFIGLSGAGLFVLYRKYRRALDEHERTNLRFMLWGMTASIVPSGLVGIILPSFGFTSLDWLSPFTVLATVTVIFYSILKYQQMNVKTVAAEIFVLVMAIVLFVNIFLGESVFGIVGKVFIFIAFAFLSYLFIRSIIKEAQQKEQLSDLNQNLNQKVAEQTTEIRKSYEEEKTLRIDLEKANEGLRELDKRKTEFLSVVAHQLRTPLSGIKWAISMLMHDKVHEPSDEQKKLLALCETGNERMITIVNTMLHAARIGEGKILDLARTETDLPALISEVITELALVAKERGITVTFTHDENIPKLSIDREMVRVAVQSLIENAIKYSKPSGAVSVRIEMQGTQVQCSIADNGIGIPADQQQYIFTRFLRAKNAISTDPNGNGLGLFIAKSILESHGGTIRFTSEENKGTTFYFTLNV
ncbi:MAG: ATP-binding protein [Candidatus Kaiserbacteria bacterium]|nr:ATP-binding protein [Candidatus Kaiserbacteria bacterium]